MTTTEQTTSLHYMTATPEQLREAHQGWMRALNGWANLAQPRRRDGGASARGTGKALREVEFIERVARKRGVAL